MGIGRVYPPLIRLTTEKNGVECTVGMKREGLLLWCLFVSTLTAQTEPDWILETRRKPDFLLFEQEMRSGDPILTSHLLSSLEKEMEETSPHLNTQEILYLLEGVLTRGEGRRDHLTLQKVTNLLSRIDPHERTPVILRILSEEGERRSVLPRYLLPLIADEDSPLTPQGISVLGNLIEYYGVVEPDLSLFSLVLRCAEVHARRTPLLFQDESFLSPLILSLEGPFPRGTTERVYALLEGILYGWEE
ncbi:hypothetical protein STHERM_c10640 [Spirochaeta thermophila DSM 6192]|uniref:Uncharacterized protein n=2 Tax=Winmispira thermophila TaxID=154 RepID=E0RSM1_WINT6|nr:hypothetical protein STHERM_c10640 [Spirochaeta thermophila DSM 6192]